MTVSLQVLYPVVDGVDFDFEYYFSHHMPLVAEYMGEFIEMTLVTKGLASGPETPSPYYAIASMTFADKTSLDSAMRVADPVIEDIANFYNAEPEMMVGEVCI
ncbi:EthD family reductase [Marinomonas mediterranea]|uniref:Ethyl tert-butyl ether degradation EthD n=1 Tax=Marinomonas mediterranea (strain ATCC 700492 / JCM 21426 / NBRC 103028 / MMB-1) TaxID=717774 RepID=F2JUR0_MARM1|nr:EthD family reductase [Marinomonas mediterranea]ADZ90475.1 Ethyl tert-butyl ether degradation EthD [Marinomonas mediterranea MMB-1]WCN08530.1 EthD family reductase [Marinomonas mediterranea]WCN12584.1 EthD family reductase [Marinomonas mediterranea]WCN16655.1 EthD family reductase [Marinomonas mediterranea MMB-1]